MINCDICDNKKMSYLFRKDSVSYFKCSSCGLKKIYPQPSINKLDEIYNSAYYEYQGAWKTDAVRLPKKRTFRDRLDLIPRLENRRVLDCGCAAGYFLEVAGEYGFIPYGVEINQAAVSICRNNFPHEQIYLGQLENAPFPKEFFYAIFMNDFLEHIKDPVRILKMAYGLLEHGGYLIISTPAADSLSCKIMKSHWPHYKMEHLFYFSKKSINLMFAKTDFELLDIKRTWKCLTLDYIKSHLLKYSQKKTAFFISDLVDSMPSVIRFQQIWLSLGEMTVVAKKA